MYNSIYSLIKYVGGNLFIILFFINLEFLSDLIRDEILQKNNKRYLIFITINIMLICIFNFLLILYIFYENIFKK